ncbi:MAG TPA: hypothetical protein VM221_11860 [Armatimonadota bacterium]|nr:hypothetical protein [Armatimonadota bacterium]
MSSDASTRPDSKPWDRQKGESTVSHQAFVVYRDLGASRTFVGAAHALEKSISLVRRWAARYDWRDRVWAWDVSQARQAEEALRQQREEALRRQARDADQLQRLAMARLSGLIHRDSETGEVRLDDSVRPRDAVAIYKWGVELEDRITEAPSAATVEDATEQQLKRMSTEQLRELLALSRERAGEDVGETDDDD